MKVAEGTSSPYFACKRPWTKESRCSSYFQRSSSSVYGSIQALNPLIRTWTDEEAPQCTRRTSSDDQHVVCRSCKTYIEKAMEPFSFYCKIVNTKSLFQDFDLTTTQQAKEEQQQQKKACFEWIGPKAEVLVRHLCPHQCYLRAFAPCRDWVALRKEIQIQSNQSIDTLLEGWTCRLVVPKSSESTSWTKQEQQQQQQQQPKEGDYQITSIVSGDIDETTSHNDIIGTRPKRLQKEVTFLSPRTEFVPTNHGKEKSFSNVKKVLKVLDLNPKHDNTKGHYDGNLHTTTPQLSNEPSGFETDEVLNLTKIPRQLHFAMRDNGKRANDQIHASVVMREFSSCGDLASPLGLLEELYGHDPWRLLLSTILLNRTQRNQVDGVLWIFLELWSNAKSALQADLQEMTSIIARCGIKHRRARGIQKFSRDYLRLVHSKQQQDETTPGFCGHYNKRNAEFEFTRTEITNLYHCGDYAADAYQIFIRRDWHTCHPRDHALRAYVEWKRSDESFRETCAERSITANSKLLDKERIR